MKTFLVAVGLCAGANAAWADNTTVGETDNSSNAWADTKYYGLERNKTLHLEFVNNNAGAGDSWHNFLIRLTDDEVPTKTYVCYRADNYGWGTCYDGGLCQSNWDWSNFMGNLDGATVKLDVIREDNIVTIDANVTTTSSKSFFQKYYADLGTTDDIKVCLSCEKSHIIIDNEKTSITQTSYTNEGAWSWSNDLSSASDVVSVTGSGTFVSGDPYFGTVYQNVGTAKRTNYLQLPSTLLSHSKYTQELTIGFWVNANNATEEDYNWTPIFSAYANAPSETNGNGTPMFVAQYRGLLQVNNSGWSDYTDAQNVSGTNVVYNKNADKNWLSDNEWHYYTIVLDGNNAKVYFDGEVKNEWDASKKDGNNDRCTQRGLFFFGDALDYICLGGNQAWSLGDNDSPFKFAKFYASNSALSASEIAAKMAEDKSVRKSISSAGWATYCSPYALNLADASATLEDAYIVTGGNDGVLTLTSVKDGTVPANTGLLLEGTAGDVVIPIVGSSTTNVDANKLVGVTAETVLDANDGYVLMGSPSVGFYQNSNAFTVGANTAYLPATFAATARSFYSFGDATAIKAIDNLRFAIDNYYNVAGQRVAAPTKGLYIKNGKKIVVK